MSDLHLSSIIPKIKARKWFILQLAISRLVVLALLLASDLLVPLPSSVENPPALYSMPSSRRSLSWLSSPFQRALGTFEVWDSVHYLRLSSLERGVHPRLEDIAFHRFYPGLIKFSSDLIECVTSLKVPPTMISLTISNASFVVSGLLLSLYAEMTLTTSATFLRTLEYIYILTPSNVFNSTTNVESVISTFIYLYYFLKVCKP